MVVAGRAPAGDGGPHRRSPTSWGDGKSCPMGGRCRKSALGGGNPHRRGPTSLGEGESCSGGGRCPKNSCRGQQPLSARTHGLGQSVLPRLCSPVKERWWGMVTPNKARAHRLGRREVLPSRWLLLVECLQGVVVCSGAGLPARGARGPAQLVAVGETRPAKVSLPHGPWFRRVPPYIGHDPQVWEGSARHRAPPTSACTQGEGEVPPGRPTTPSRPASPHACPTTRSPSAPFPTTL